MNKEDAITDSRFSMWRGVVLVIHADGVVTSHERAFINEYMRSLNLSASQRDIIADDLENPKNTYEIFKNITDKQDKMDFFILARAAAWCDGNFVQQEGHIINLFKREMLDEGDMAILQESRDVCGELELSGDQWRCQTARRKNLFKILTSSKD